MYSLYKGGGGVRGNLLKKRLWLGSFLLVIISLYCVVYHFEYASN